MFFTGGDPVYLDYFYTGLHLAVIFVNVFLPFLTFGRLYLLKFSFSLQILTLISWLGLGIFFGIGYCPLTDIHWKLKRELGENDLPASFIKYLIDYIFSTNSDPFFIDILTVSSLVLAMAFNIRRIFF